MHKPADLLPYSTTKLCHGAIVVVVVCRLVRPPIREARWLEGSHVSNGWKNRIERKRGSLPRESREDEYGVYVGDMRLA